MQPHLVLHFDVNKTILVDDKVQGIDVATACVQILYWAAWGHVKRGEWVWNGEEPSLKRRDRRAVLYGDYVRQQRISRRQKFERKRDFIRAGQPGAALKPHFRRMMSALTLSDDVQAALGKTDWAASAGLTKGRMRLLPSFFNVLRHLRKSGREWTLVFRTYGSDIPEVAAEFNAFCRGEHPLYPGERLDMALEMDNPEHFGAVHRGGQGASDKDMVTLALGVLDNPPGRDKPPYPCPLGFFEERAHRLVSPASSVWEHIDAHRGKTLALRDDYAFWARNRFKSWAGKPLQIDFEDDQVHHIFFDDNVFASDARIIDVRDAATGETVPLAKVRDRHVVRVEPYKAILDDRWFIDRLADAGV